MLPSEEAPETFRLKRFLGHGPLVTHDVEAVTRRSKLHETPFARSVG